MTDPAGKQRRDSRRRRRGPRDRGRSRRWPARRRLRSSIAIAARGEELATLLNDKVGVPAQFVQWEGDYEVPPETDVVINATSIGLGDAEARVPLAIATLEADMVVADVIFNPPETRLIARRASPRLPDARRAGHAGESGRDRLSRSGPARTPTPR